MLGEHLPNRLLKKGVKAAIDASGGNMSNLARKLKIAPQSIREWVLRGKIPSERVLLVERATGVPKERLRPDIYPTKEASE